jgi:hypothetical protein
MVQVPTNQPSILSRSNEPSDEYSIKSLFQFSNLIRQFLVKKHQSQTIISPSNLHVSPNASNSTSTVNFQNGHGSGSNSTSPTNKRDPPIDSIHRRMLQTIIYNVIIGNQIIIRGDNMQFVNSICALFTVSNLIFILIIHIEYYTSKLCKFNNRYLVLQAELSSKLSYY